LFDGPSKLPEVNKKSLKIIKIKGHKMQEIDDDCERGS